MQKTAIFHGKFDSADDVKAEFEVSDTDWADVQDVLYANYDQDGYCGSATVVYRGWDQRLYMVEGGHCSCNGLEGQWGPTETSLGALKMMKPDEEYRPGWQDFYHSIA